MKNSAWLISFAAVGIAAGIGVSSVTVHIDPYMHYRKPLTDEYYYSLNNQRSQNDGITKHFDYDALITGTSMTENFRSSEFDKIFGVNSIKVPYSGGSFKEMNDNLIIALRTHSNLKTIIRALDRYGFVSDADAMREDLGTYPTYLYDRNPFNDVQYLFNRDVLYSIDGSMYEGKKQGNAPGITSFDDYSNWMSAYTFGQKTVIPTMATTDDDTTSKSLSDEEKNTIKETVTKNVTSLADKYPNTQFYYFLPPYSATYFQSLKQFGRLRKEVDIEEYAASLIIPHKNIHLFTWNRFDLWDDLNNYKDTIHYADWINSWMLVQMHNETGSLTEDNYKQVFEEEFDHYDTFDYNTLSEQEDYEADYYAAGLLNKEITGMESLRIDKTYLQKTELKNCEIVSDQYNKSDGISCKGALVRESGSQDTPAVAAYKGDYCGTRFSIDATDYRAVTFYGKKVTDNGQPSVYIYDESGNLLKSIEQSYPDIDNEWHQFALSLEGIYGNVTIVMNGGYIDNSGSAYSEYIFSDIMVY